MSQHPSQHIHAPASQRGVVLVIALIVLVVVSMLASMSIRNATSTEAVTAGVRTTQMASQAAEVALRYCEAAAIQSVTGTGTLASLPTITAYVTPQLWQSTSNWDTATSAAFVVPAASINQSGISATFRRLPECMVEPLPTWSVAAGTVSNTISFIITARGFGPEVAAADANRSRPVGSEVWLQSTIELE